MFDLNTFIKNHFKLALKDFGLATQKYNYDLFVYSLKCLGAGFDMLRIAKGLAGGKGRGWFGLKRVLVRVIG